MSKTPIYLQDLMLNGSLFSIKIFEGSNQFHLQITYKFVIFISNFCTSFEAQCITKSILLKVVCSTIVGLQNLPYIMCIQSFTIQVYKSSFFGLLHVTLKDLHLCTNLSLSRRFFGDFLCSYIEYP